MTSIDYGRIAYDAYWFERDGHDPADSNYPQLTDAQKTAWRAVRRGQPKGGCREPEKARREAEIAEVLAGGPLTVQGIARQMLGITTTERIPQSVSARITQSLRVMENDGIVKSAPGAHNRRDWSLAR
jgi:hypothetical protein